MGISAHIARLRAAVGHDLLLLPAVSVLPIDQAGRLLLVRHAGHHDGWAVLGGAVEVGESPAEAAIRETREETGVEVRLVRLLDVLGGPDYEVHYPNGDQVAYVTAVYEAAIIAGSPAPRDGELSDTAWFTRGQLADLDLTRFARALLWATGYLSHPGSLPGAGGWPVAVQDLGLAGVPGRGGPVGVQHQCPAPPVNDHLVVEGAEQDAVAEAGVAAVGFVLDVVDLAGGGGLVAAAGPAAVPVAQDDRVADGGGDGVGVADVQRQAGPGQAGAELVGPQEGGQAAGAGQQVGDLADDGLLDRLPGHPGELL